MKKLFLAAALVVLFNYAKAQVPILNSMPSASSVIFLDFDGHTVEGTVWNFNGPIVCGASGNNNTQITEIFNRVAEDYRPFVVNVTTDSLKFLAAPVNNRMRVILTVNHQWYGTTGGVAYVGSFSWGNDTPCFVFTAALGVNNVKFISEAAAHEAGHTLGLFHQSNYDANCVKISDYHYGTGSGEIGWAPIMGVGYYKNLTLWHNGPNPYGCTSYQNDMAVIADPVNGITIKADDNNNTTSGAPLLIIANNSFASSGVFEQSNDADLFKITLAANLRLLMNVRPANVGSQNAGGNNDILTELYSNSMSHLKSSNPLDLLQATIDTVLNPGTYYVRVKPVANAYAGTYGMRGAYIINGTTAPVTTLPLRKLILTGKVIGKNHNLQWLIEADEQITEAALEYSYNGFTFANLSVSMAASGTYNYEPAASGRVYYRMKVVLDNGEKHYSKTLALDASGMRIEPKVVTNPVNNGTIAIIGTDEYHYTLMDMQGRKIKAGSLENGITKIMIQSLLKGMYLVRFTGKDGSGSTQKIIVH